MVPDWKFDDRVTMSISLILFFASRATFPPEPASPCCDIEKELMVIVSLLLF
jgi:hypothetical protein